MKWWAQVLRGGLPLLLAMKGNFDSWNAPLATIIQVEMGEGAGSVGGIWFLSAQAVVKVRGWEVERKRMFTFSSWCLSCLFLQGGGG